MKSIMGHALDELRVHSTQKWIRAKVGGETVVDSRAARLAWEPRRVTPLYAVPVADIAGGLVASEVPLVADDGRRVLDPSVPFLVHSTPGSSYSIEARGRSLPNAAFVPDDADLEGYAILDWDAFDQWFEEAEEVMGHPHDPFARIDCRRSDRHVVITHEGVTLADSKSPTLLFETSLPVRFYLPAEDVRLDLLSPSEHTTVCAYKGVAGYLSATVNGRVTPNIAWVYREPLLEGEPVRDMICFWPNLVEMTVDGETLPRPTNPMS